MASRNNRTLIPEARQALNSFKTEVASSLNINLKQGYNGDLTSRQAGSIGGEMVKRMIAYAEQNMNGSSNMMK
ncbi:MAG TPA: alpha/beta-type small acid-soluble spore protein [Clostridiales bacterium]|jgi:small acid-soluble spore protein D (minor alpha/beta-type SASP)|nr:alpha/beta-type small acid-soluble spore protein [Clostridiales bacterium]